MAMAHDSWGTALDGKPNIPENESPCLLLLSKRTGFTKGSFPTSPAIKSPSPNAAKVGVPCLRGLPLTGACHESQAESRKHVNRADLYPNPVATPETYHNISLSNPRKSPLKLYAPRPSRSSSLGLEWQRPNGETRSAPKSLLFLGSAQLFLSLRYPSEW
jgi:hypothetical protein